ncbi:MAG TPA: phosphatidylserine/phosphatidylglycerophosphate/cardiolipin synthase family protein [Pirellulales bacterium]|nr:phosphatidylserine/phosphatidylglycerophosphate/cardiolipin synthase family protein [Pirellulales bacterium]
MSPLLPTLGGMLLLCCSTAAAWADENRFRLLHADHEAAQTRADLIGSATTSVETTYYSIGDDRIGAWYVSLLKDAALRGVRVRLVVDAAHNDLPADVQRHLVNCGVAIREFHPHGTGHPTWYNRRMHDKTLIVDDRHLVVGSRNMLDSHFGLAEFNYVDRDAYLRGDVAQRARRYFDCLWTCAEVRPTDFRDTHAQQRRQRKEARGNATPSSRGGEHVCPEAWLAAGCDLAICGQPIDCRSPRDLCAETCPVACVGFLYDPCGLKGKPRGISEQLLDLLGGARTSIVLETPYFVMSHDLKRVLAAATARGVHVAILTNSLASTDHTTVTAEFHNQKPWLLRHGVEIWELAGPNHLHAKTAVVDGRTAFVGSYNFDPRSESLNTETGVVVHDPTIAQWALNSVGEHMRRSYRFGPDGRAYADGSRHPGATCTRILGMQPLRLLAPPLRGSL